VGVERGAVHNCGDRGGQHADRAVVDGGQPVSCRGRGVLDPQPLVDAD
jgi:hypothetical protein